jgi:cation transport regulator ChaB
MSEIIVCEFCERTYTTHRKLARHLKRSTICGPLNRPETKQHDEVCEFSDVLESMLRPIYNLHLDEIRDLTQKYEKRIKNINEAHEVAIDAIKEKYENELEEQD